jgi:hypothetical protein
MTATWAPEEPNGLELAANPTFEERACASFTLRRQMTTSFSVIELPLELCSVPLLTTWAS